MNCPPGYEISPKTGNCVLKCKPGYHRNRKTGRCRKSPTRLSPPKQYTACPVGYIRSPKSGRCRKLPFDEINYSLDELASAFNKMNIEGGRPKRKRGGAQSGIDKRRRVQEQEELSNLFNMMNVSKCPPGYEISLKSGNCVKKCKPGYYRNPLTGRCKKISSSSVITAPEDDELADLFSAMNTGRRRR